MHSGQLYLLLNDMLCFKECDEDFQLYIGEIVLLIDNNSINDRYLFIDNCIVRNHWHESSFIDSTKCISII